jgi:3D (Asp-Asp-Asp) domain-containing protein
MDIDQRLTRHGGESRLTWRLRICPALLTAASLLLAAPGCRMAPADAQEPAHAQEPAGGGTTVVRTGRLREFSVTAYCTGRVTQSGARVRAGMAAADPRVLPVGSTIRIDGRGRAYDGIYTVTDTGREIKGRELDLYIDDCAEAEQFGRKTMIVAVIRRGWNPAATPGAVGTSGR